MRIHSFEPIINKGCRVLILGSMPGIESLRKQEYYGHLQNKFWDVIYGIFKEIPDKEYKLKKLFLLNYRIALWDVIESCERTGSADSAIRNIKINDFDLLLKEYPEIQYIFFNGKTAEKLFLENFHYATLKTAYLGSTSPANAVPLQKRINEWSAIFKYLKSIRI